jgi:hypothetical protein
MFKLFTFPIETFANFFPLRTSPQLTELSSFHHQTKTCQNHPQRSFDHINRKTLAHQPELLVLEEEFMLWKY